MVLFRVEHKKKKKKEKIQGPFFWGKKNNKPLFAWLFHDKIVKNIDNASLHSGSNSLLQVCSPQHTVSPLLYARQWQTREQKANDSQVTNTKYDHQMAVQRVETKKGEKNRDQNKKQ